MNRTHRLRLVLCTLLCFVLCSCQTVLPANEKAQVEELLRAPKLSGDYGALQTALNDWLGESAQLKYPIQGELLSPFVLQDLDGDGQQDAQEFFGVVFQKKYLHKNRPAGCSGRKTGIDSHPLYTF